MLFFIKANGQCGIDSIYIGELETLPQNYQFGDTIKIILPVSTPDVSLNLGHTFTIDSNQINISACYYISGTMPSSSHFVDTIILGVLQEGNYNLTVYAYCSTDTICTYSDVFTKLVSFSILSIGIPEYNKSNNFSFYPNPTSNNVTVLFDNTGDKKFLIKIYDVVGNKVFSKEFTTNENSVNISLDNISKGVYICRITNASEIDLYKEKLVIIK